MGHPISVAMKVLMIGVLALDDLVLAAEGLDGGVDKLIGLSMNFLFEGVSID